MIVATVSEVFIILIVQNENKLSFVKSDFIYDISDYVITSICSTSEKRIFLGSQNNYLYELDYNVILPLLYNRTDTLSLDFTRNHVK
jgi:hypothetical protein